MLNLKNSIIIIVLIAIFSAFGFSKIYITNAPNSYLPADMVSNILNTELTNKFNNDESLIFIFDFKDPDIDYLKRLSAFIIQIESLDKTKKVHSIFNYDSIYGDSDGFTIKHLIDHHNLNEFDYEKFTKDVKHDRFIHQLTISKDLTKISVIVEPLLIEESLTRMEYEKKVLKSLGENELNKKMLAYGGEFAVDTYQFKELDYITSTIVPITFGLGLFLLYILFHSLSGMILGALANGIVTLFVFSLFGHFNMPYNMIGSTVPTLMMALSIAYIVHLYNAIVLRIDSENDFKAVVSSAVDAIKKPSFYSALTTTAGLFSLTVSPIPPIKSMGIIGGLGVIFIFMTIIYLLPPIIVRFSNKNSWSENQFFKKLFNHFASKSLILIINNPKKVVFLITMVFVVFSAFIFKVESETNLYKFFLPSHPINQSTDIIEENFSGPTIINISIKGETELLQKELLTQMDKFKLEALKIKEIDRVFSSADIIKQIHWAFNGEKEAFFTVPPSTELIEQYLFIYDGMDLYNFLSRDFKHHKISINLNVKGANEIQMVENQLKILSDKIFTGDYKVAYTGMGKLFSDQEDLIVDTQLQSLLLSVVVIFIFMLISWRSFKDSLICMVPNISPILTMFIIMGIFSIYLDMGTAIIASIIIGIAIDDTIHFYSVFSEHKKTKSLGEALEIAFSETGRAIIITTIILGVQFVLMGFTSFMPLKYFGILTSIGIFAALIFDLIYLPALIVIFNSKSMSSAK